MNQDGCQPSSHPLGVWSVKTGGCEVGDVVWRNLTSADYLVRMRSICICKVKEVEDDKNELFLQGDF